jgi:hypothetical protein
MKRATAAAEPPVDEDDAAARLNDSLSITTSIERLLLPPLAPPTPSNEIDGIEIEQDNRVESAGAVN